MNSLLKILLIIPVRIYQKVISPPLHFLTGPFSGCRFFPSCSQYFIDAVTVQGPFRGTCLGVWRVLRCNPWGGQGYDPPPGWEEYVAEHPEAARSGRRDIDLPENFFGRAHAHSHSCQYPRTAVQGQPGGPEPENQTISQGQSS